MFWNRQRLFEAGDVINTYNLDDDWSSNGLKIWTNDFHENQMLVLREPKEDIGAFQKNLETVLPLVSAVITTNHKNYLSYNIPIIEVYDTNKFIVDLAQYIRKLYCGKVVTITGSSGKSTVTKMIYDCLNIYGASCNLTHENTVYGMSWNMTNFNIDSKYWVIESSIGRGVITYPNIAVITNLAPVHLGKNQTIDFIAKAKSKIFDTMKNGDYAVIYNEIECFDIFYNAALKKGLNVIKVGESKNSDICVDMENSEINVYGNVYTFEDNTPKHIMLDFALTFAVTHCAGENLDSTYNVLKEFKKLEGRGDTVCGKFSKNINLTVVDESYNANFLSMRITLEAFEKKYALDNKILVLGDMSEGGDKSLDYHEQLIPVINKINARKVFLLGEFMSKLCKNVHNSETVLDVYDLHDKLLNELKDNDVVFLKGSNSTKIHCTATMLKDIMKKF